MAQRKPDVAVIVIALLALPLFLYGLGDTYLWQDEAQTALLGRSVLTHGVPMVGHGADSLSAVLGRDEGFGGMYFQTSWLQAYLAAASFKVVGESSWAARLPFAIAGWSCVPLAAWAIRNAGSSLIAGRTAALLIALNVPFIIFSRQARYYPIAAAATLLATGSYAVLWRRALRKDLRATVPSIFFGLAAGLLALSFDVTAIGVLGALAVHWVVTTRKDTGRWSAAFWVPWGAGCVVLIAWIGMSFTAASRQEQAGAAMLLRRIRQGVFYYLGQLNAHVLPLPFLLTLAPLWRRRNDNETVDWAVGHRDCAVLFGAVALGGVLGATLPPDRFFRYAVAALPIMLALYAIGLASVWSLGRWGKVLAAGLLIALVSSNAPMVWSHAILGQLARASRLVTVRDRPMRYRVPLRLLIGEFQDPPRGPIAAMVAYLRNHAGPHDVLVATYGDLPLKFHTRLRVYGGETGELPPADVKPDWIWSRHLWVYGQIRPAADWIARELESGRYRAIEIGAIDRRWENREDPTEHIFSNPGPDGPPLILHRLSSAAE